MQLAVRNPDILSCLANLSSDEVFTPPHLANQMLDGLPTNLWSDPDARFLDPCTKSGVFLREITKRLMVGLEKEIPSWRDRLHHILTKQVFGLAISELTALVARRTLYCNKAANSPMSLLPAMSTGQGNILYSRTEHEWHKGACRFCGATAKMHDRGSELENFAYSFIHDDVPSPIADLSFDLIIGGPPFHLKDSDENVGSSPIYQLFVEKAISLNPRYVSMVIPARWFAGGKNLDRFRERMLSDQRIASLTDYPITGEIFPRGLKVIGGVCYFLWDRQHEGSCRIETRMNGQRHVAIRKLDQFDTFVRFNQAIPILKKVMAKNLPSLSEWVSSQKPFGLRTYDRPTGQGDVYLYASKTEGYISRERIIRNEDWLPRWKVLLSMGYGEGGERSEYPRRIINKAIVASPGSACTETYLVVGLFETEQEAVSLQKYLGTRFARFLIALRKNTQHVSKDRFNFVPIVPLDQTWDDKLLFEFFELSDSEKSFIESIVKPSGEPDA